MTERVPVTRGAAFTESHILERLLDEGAALTVLDVCGTEHGFEDTRRRGLDFPHPRDELGFLASVRLEDDLARTLDWCSSTMPW